MTFVRSVVLLAACVVAVRAQVPSLPDSLRAIDEEVLTRPETEIRVLGRSRALLRDAILSGDHAKAARVLAYLDARFDSARVTVLSPRERLLAEFWVGQYDRVLTDPERAAQVSWTEELATPIYQRPRLYADPDLLQEDLVDHSRNRQTELIARTQTASVSAEQRNFLRLFVTVLIGPDPSTNNGFETYRKTMNEEATEFLAMYPRSSYEPFVRRYMRLILRPSPWAYGIGGGLGGTRMEGELGRWFTSGICFDLWGEVTYRSAYLMLWATLGTLSEVRSTFSYNQTWFTGTTVSPSGLVLAAGYTFTISTRLVITPHAGWAYIDISPPEQERTNTGFDGKMDFGAAVVGVNVDLPFLRDDGPMAEGAERGYQFIRARIALMRASTHIPFAQGSMVSFTLSYGLFGRPIEREL